MKKLTIKSWAIEDRPREKLILKGKSVLTDAELIAILIGSGTKKESAVELSKRILNSVNNNINKLAALTFEQLKEFKGIELINLAEDKLKEKLNKSADILSRIGNVNLRALEVYDDIKEEYDKITVE